MKLFSVYDKKVAAYAAPFLSRTSGEAIRNFTELASGDNLVGKYPEDYSLMCIGEFDESSGIITVPSTGPAFVIGALEVKPSEGEIMRPPGPRGVAL